MKQSEVKPFAAEMAKRCDVTITSWAALGRLAKWIARRIVRKTIGAGLPQMERSLRPCCLSIFGKMFVVLDFEPGCPEVSGDRQRDVIVHECGHAFDVRDYIRDTGKRASNWLRNYAFDDVFRSWAEAGPCVAEAEVRHFSGQDYGPQDIDTSAYWIPKDSDGPQLFRERYHKCYMTVMSQGQGGAPTQKAAKVAIDILRGR